MPQLDLNTYSNSVLVIYIGFWLYFIVCASSATYVFQRTVLNLFYGYAFLLPTYMRLVASFINK